MDDFTNDDARHDAGQEPQSEPQIAVPEPQPEPHDAGQGVQPELPTIGYGQVSVIEAAPGLERVKRPQEGYVRETTAYQVPWANGHKALWAAAAVALLALSACLVPLLLISPYDHSYADDWHYAVPVHQALEAGGGIFGALWAALVQVGNTFVSWQGTYSAIFLMALEPGVFGEQFYVISGPLVLALLIWGNCYLARVLLGELSGLPTPGWLCVAALVTCVELCVMVSPVEGVFWYNSALYYTGYQAIAQILAAQLLRLAIDPESRRGRVVGATLLAAFVAGGNFVTAFACIEAALLACLWMWVTGRREQVRRVALPVFVLVLGTAVSMLAPGNSVRQETQFSQDGAGVVGTIAGAFAYAGKDALAWLGNPYALLGLGCLVLLAVAVARENHLSYRSLWFAIFVSGEVFVSSYTPTLWSMGNEGPGRVENVRMQLLVVLVALLVFWLVGLVVRGFERTDVSTRGPLVPVLSPGLRGGACGCVLLACLVGAGLAVGAAQSKAQADKVMPVSAAFSLMDGSAIEYDAQVHRRLDFLSTTPELDVEVAFYTAGPKVLFMGDVRDNMDNYINYRLAQWYHKDSIIGVYGNP